ncbi:DsbA family protein [Candidatus Nanosalina sp. VS9-1]|uniref:DsbA family protein n=1 Tax=Candidatus Nanosalina sp. VS9-1 TaxID=3388566 RepID=UPI0039E0E785
MSDSHECSICGEEFDSERGLKIHKGQKHPDEKEEASTEDVSNDENEGEEAAENSVDNDNSESTGGDTVDLSFSVRQAITVAFALGLFVGFTGGFVTSSITPGPEASPSGDTGDSGSQLEKVDIGNISFEDEPSLGEADAPIKVVEYTDFGCPYCAEWNGYDASPRLPIDTQQNHQKLKEQYIETGQVELIMKDYPVPNLHPNAIRAHAAANCVYDQSEERYWDYAAELFDRRDTWMAGGQNRTTETFNDIASGMQEIDNEEFTQCYLSTDGSEMAEDKNNAIRNIGRLGTPTFLVGNQENGFVKISGAQPLSNFEKAFEQIQS